LIHTHVGNAQQINMDGFAFNGQPGGELGLSTLTYSSYFSLVNSQSAATSGKKRSQPSAHQLYTGTCLWGMLQLPFGGVVVRAQKITNGRQSSSQNMGFSLARCCLVSFSTLGS
jgi:hypothetical protein